MGREGGGVMLRLETTLLTPHFSFRHWHTFCRSAVLWEHNLQKHSKLIKNKWKFNWKIYSFSCLAWASHLLCLDGITKVLSQGTGQNWNLNTSTHNFERLIGPIWSGLKWQVTCVGGLAPPPASPKNKEETIKEFPRRRDLKCARREK